MEVLKLEGKFDFHPKCGGKDKFEIILKALVADSASKLSDQRKAIVIVADNDGDPAVAFKNVQKQIAAAGFTVPQKQREITTTPQLPPLSVLMIPWDNDPGCLESLCLRAVNKNYSKQLECAEKLVECVNATAWEIAKVSKLRMRCFLSGVCKTDPNTGLRYAWGAEGGRPGDIFPLDNPIFTPIAEYLRGFIA